MEAPRDRKILRVVLIEGCANALATAAKLGVGLATGSLAILGDALHSLTDLANNVVAWFVIRMAARPPDRDHPYGHRKFETLAVFGLAGLLTVMAFELAGHALRRGPSAVSQGPWSLAGMLALLVGNSVVALWEGRWARRLDSDILRADARHTLADVLTTAAVIAGWQLAARGWPWLDALCAVGVAGLILSLAYGLFRRAIPVLVDQAALPSEAVARLVGGVAGVRQVGGIRSRRDGSGIRVEVVVRVDPGLSTEASHAIASRVEATLRRGLAVGDVSVHVEPEAAPTSSPDR